MRKSIEAVSPVLGKRMASKGHGSKFLLVGNGSDDLSDALDRRVELQVRDCS